MDQKSIENLASVGRHQECLQACEQLLQTNAECPFLWKFAGKSLLALGQFEKAQHYLTKALQLDQIDKIIPFNLGLCLLRIGSNIDAVEAFKLAVKLDDSFLPAWGNIGSALINEGMHREALPATLKVIELDPTDPTAHMNLGNIYKNLENLDKALASTLKSLELKPDNPDALTNLGGIYKDLGNLDQALVSTLKSLELKPNNPNAHMNLGNIYKDLGNFDNALASTIKSLELMPNNPTAYMNLGSIYKDLGNFDKALAFTLKSLELKPDNPTAHMNLGSIYKDLGKLDQALASTLKSLELKPDNVSAHLNLASIYKDHGDIHETIRTYIKASELKPNDISLKLNSIAQIDDIQASRERILAQRQQFEQGIEETITQMGLVFNGTPIHIGAFWLPYHNARNDKAVLSRTADAFTACNAFKNLINKSSLPKTSKDDESAEYKIGFYFDNPQLGHSVNKLFSEIVHSVTTSGFNTWVIMPPGRTDSKRETISSLSIGSLKLSSNIFTAIKQIRDLDLDLLIFTECTSSWYPYILSMVRLAQVQVGTWGNPVTTGSSEIDYYLSSSLIEPSDAQKHYRERLVKLSRLPSKYKSPDISQVKSDREKFRLEPSHTLIGIPQSLFKLHPDYDDVLEKIISRLPDTRYVLIEGQNKLQTDRLKARWVKKAPITIASTIFLPRMSQTDYLSLLETMDLLLDPIYFGSGNTFYEAMALGTPLVTMLGDYMRGRIVAGGYNQMKLERPPIAADIKDYIELTVRLAENAELRAQIKQEIKTAARQYLFDDQEAADEFIEFIKAAIDENRRTSGLLPFDWQATKKYSL